MGQDTKSRAAPELVLWFGAHKGKTIEDCPSSYLRWLARNFDDDRLVGAAEAELSYRDDHGGHHEE